MLYSDCFVNGKIDAGFYREFIAALAKLVGLSVEEATADIVADYAAM